MRRLARTAFAVVVLLGAAGPALADAGPCDAESLVIGRVECLIEAAETAGDPALCERTEDNVARFHCLSLYAEHSGDPAPCARIVAEADQVMVLRGACIGGTAVANDAPELCASAGHPTLRDSCYLMLVMEKGADAALCAEIVNPKLRRICADAPPPAK